MKLKNLKLFQIFLRARFLILFFSLLPAVCCLLPVLHAAESSAAQFLKLGFGARALGMGESFVAISDDLSAIHYNPAGLSAYESEDRELLVSHSWHIQDMGLSQIGYKSGSFGSLLTYFSAGDIEGRDASGVLTNNFTAEDMAFSAGYGFDIFGIHAGASIKYIRQKIESSNATAGAIDFGLLYLIEDSPFAIGASVCNAGTKVKFQAKSYSLPLIYRFGVSYNKEDAPFLFSAQFDLPNDSDGIFRFGGEYRKFGAITPRLGYMTMAKSQSDAVLGKELGSLSSGLSNLYGFFMGIGFEHSDFKLDYALLPYGELGNAHRFSVNLKF